MRGKGTEETCSNCGARTTVRRTSTYRFSESGLKNVVLIGIKVIRCRACKNEDPIIPSMNGLMKVLALAVVEKPWRLEGDEVKYLRKYLGMSGEEFSKHLGIDSTTLSKWENGSDPVGTKSDRLVRALALTLGEGLKDSTERVVRMFPDIESVLHACKYVVDPEKQEVEYA